MTVTTGRIRGGLVVRLAHPERANTLTIDVIDELRDAADEARAAGFLLFTGTGRVFCGGLDRAEVERIFTDRRSAIRTIWRFQSLVREIRALPVPVVSYADGAVVGGGCGLFLAADHCLAGPAFRMRLAFARLGLYPDMGVSATLPARTGTTEYQRLYLQDRTIDADEAKALRVTDNLGQPACSFDDAIAFAAERASSSADTGRLRRRAGRGPGRLRLDAALAFETIRQSRLGLALQPTDLVAR